MSTGPRAYALTWKAHQYLDMYGDAPVRDDPVDPNNRRPCPVCARPCAVTKSGRVRIHNNVDTNEWCWGSKKKPGPASPPEVQP